LCNQFALRLGFGIFGERQMSSNFPFIGIFMNFGEAGREISARRDAFPEGVNSGGARPGPVPGLTIALRFGNANFSNYPQLAQECNAAESSD
jgi:hypothetical protein